jgi:hypothetical protein
MHFYASGKRQSHGIQSRFVIEILARRRHKRLPLIPRNGGMSRWQLKTNVMPVALRWVAT